jgi:hypothetical protein
MCASAEGRSNLDIPRSVGEKFCHGDEKPGVADEEANEKLREFLKAKGFNAADIAKAQLLAREGRAQAKDRRQARDQPPTFPGRPEREGALGKQAQDALD